MDAPDWRAVRLHGSFGRRWFVVIAAAVVAGCGSGGAEGAIPDETASGAASVQAVDDAGRTVTLAKPAERIISLVPAATETLVALGGIDLLVGRTDFDDPELDHLPSVGQGLTPSVEVLASLRPDLVIAWEEAGTARVRPRLESLGIAVFAVATQDTAGVFANVERFGRLTARADDAARLAAELRQELELVRASVDGRARPSVLYLIGLDPPMIAGPAVFISEIMEVAGGDNVFADATAAWPQISLEEILRRRPDVVILPADGAGSMSVDRLTATPGWRELAASGTTRFHALPTDVLHRPGPSIVAAARQLRGAIHPDLAASQ